MVSDKQFYAAFIEKFVQHLRDGENKDNHDDVHAADADLGDRENMEYRKNDQAAERVEFLIAQLEIIPESVRKLFKNMMKCFPTSTLYLFLSIGVLGTNISRYSVVRRPSGHTSNTIRTGCLYNFLAPSRFGKGIAMGVLTKLGHAIEQRRKTTFDTYVALASAAIPENDRRVRGAIELNCAVLRPQLVFLTGGNGLQTTAMAAKNGGCGLIAVSEIKVEKCAYTSPDGKYYPLLKFYDPDIAARSFRQAENIPRIRKCRIQMVAAGVKEDWILFVQSCTNLSGMMARVLPILAYDREMVRLEYERLPHYAFPLKGFEDALLLLEQQFATVESTVGKTPLTLQFSESVLDSNYRATNAHVVSVFEGNSAESYRGHYNALLDNAPPSSAERKEESSGCGLVSVFIEQTVAEFQPLIRSPADELFLRGLEDNLLRLSSDFFWAHYVAGYLTEDGVLTDVKETELQQDITAKLRAPLGQSPVVNIPAELVYHIFKMMRYIVKGTFHLNALASPVSPLPAVGIPAVNLAAKRKIIVLRLSEGDGGDRKRKYFISRLKRSFRDISTETLKGQLSMLKAQLVITSPTLQSVALEKHLGADAVQYLTTDCDYSAEDIAALHTANDLLTN